MRSRWSQWPRAALIAPACASLPLASQSVLGVGQRWWNTVKILADDNMEGRMTASAGYLRAADYVVDQFKKDGLQFKSCSWSDEIYFLTSATFRPRMAR